MKKLKTGFTLAEVLITIAVIGIVAALTLPNMITSYQYKTLGTKLSKFAASVESSARAYTVSNANFSTSDAANTKRFAAESFLVTSSKPSASDFNVTGAVPTDYYTKLTAAATSPVAYQLKDGTRIQISATSTAPTAYNSNDAVYGTPVFTIYFDPAVNGLPATAQKVYPFVVTELGYVFPSGGTTNPEACLKAIKDGDWASPASLFTDASSTVAKCKKATT